MAKADIYVPVAFSPKVMAALEDAFVVHKGWEASDPDALLAMLRDCARGVALAVRGIVDRPMIERLPKLEIISNLGVGYDSIDIKAAAERGIIVTNTPNVLTEEVADTAIGLLLMTVRELSAAERYLRAGKWGNEGSFRLTRGTMRNRTVGIVGLGRIGLAIARRLEAMQVPVVYNNRTPRAEIAYRYYADPKAMAKDVDTIIIALPGGPATKNLVDAELLQALGPDGVLINIGRGSVVDESALIDALENRTIQAAGLDVFAKEPRVSERLIALPNAVLLPHVASASIHTRDAMGQLVVDNLTNWFHHGEPLTAVPETPWPRTA